MVCTEIGRRSPGTDIGWLLKDPLKLVTNVSFSVAHLLYPLQATFSCFSKITGRIEIFSGLSIAAYLQVSSCISVLHTKHEKKRVHYLKYLQFRIAYVMNPLARATASGLSYPTKNYEKLLLFSVAASYVADGLEAKDSMFVLRGNRTAVSQYMCKAEREIF